MRALLVCLLVCCSGSAGAAEIVVDFEADPDGSALVEGDDATDFEAWYVSFYLPGRLAPPRIASHGAPCRAFEVYEPGVGLDCDTTTSGQNVMTDGGRKFADFGAAFSHPVSEASLSLIDFGDCTSGALGTTAWVELRGLDGAGDLVDAEAVSIVRHAAGSADDGNVITMTVSGQDIVTVETRGAGRDCGKGVDDVRFVLQDLDGDGVIDGDDLCPDTPAGVTTDTDGCHVDAVCPCEDAWANHGEYVVCATEFADDLEAAGLLDPGEHGAIVSAAASSDCGRP